MEPMYTIEQVAEIFKVSPRTILRLIERGELTAFQVGRQWRFKPEWVEEWIQRQAKQVKEGRG